MELVWVKKEHPKKRIWICLSFVSVVFSNQLVLFWLADHTGCPLDGMRRLFILEHKQWLGWMEGTGISSMLLYSSEVHPFF